MNVEKSVLFEDLQLLTWTKLFVLFDHELSIQVVISSVVVVIIIPVEELVSILFSVVDSVVIWIIDSVESRVGNALVLKALVSASVP